MKTLAAPIRLTLRPARPKDGARSPAAEGRTAGGRPDSETPTHRPGRGPSGKVRRLAGAGSGRAALAGAAPHGLTPRRGGDAKDFWALISEEPKEQLLNLYRDGVDILPRREDRPPASLVERSCSSRSLPRRPGFVDTFGVLVRELTLPAAGGVGVPLHGGQTSCTLRLRDGTLSGDGWRGVPGWAPGRADGRRVPGGAQGRTSKACATRKAHRFKVAGAPLRWKRSPEGSGGGDGRQLPAGH